MSLHSRRTFFFSVNRPNNDVDFINGFNSAMTVTEKLYWDYIDNYVGKEPGCYYLKLTQFLERVLPNELVPQAHDYVRRWTKYKKTIPTAGVVLTHKDGFLLLVRIRGATLWSMPKGKKEPNEDDLTTTACREFLEETGIDVSDFINEQTVSRTVVKTKFYYIESDTKVNVSQYQTNEIAQVRWVSIKEVLRDRQTRFSKQAVAVAETLMV